MPLVLGLSLLFFKIKVAVSTVIPTENGTIIPVPASVSRSVDAMREKYGSHTPPVHAYARKLFPISANIFKTLTIRQVKIYLFRSH